MSSINIAKPSKSLFSYSRILSSAMNRIHFIFLRFTLILSFFSFLIFFPHNLMLTVWLCGNISFPNSFKWVKGICLHDSLHFPSQIMDMSNFQCIIFVTYQLLFSSASFNLFQMIPIFRYAFQVPPKPQMYRLMWSDPPFELRIETLSDAFLFVFL